MKYRSISTRKNKTMHKNMKCLRWRTCVEFVSDPRSYSFNKNLLTEFITHALVLHQRGVLKSVPAVQDLGVVGEGGDSPQGQHHMVRQEGGGPLTKPCDDGTVPTVLRVTQYQNFLLLHILT